MILRLINTGSRKGMLVAFIMAVLLLLLPLAMKNKFYLHVMILVFFYAAASGAWNIIGGYGGQLSLGHAAFYGLGAYTSTLLYLHFSLTPWLGMLAAGLLSVIVAIAISYPCFRLRGPFFALATLAFAEVMRLVSIFWRDLTAGSVGLLIPFKPGLANLIFRGKEPYYYMALVLMLIVLTISLWIENSKFGYYLEALKEDEDAAEALGVRTTRYKLLAASLSAFLTALCGVFMAQYILFIEPEGVFNMNLSVQLALIPVVGGIGSAWGPIIGSFLLTPLNEFLRSWLGGDYNGLNFVLYGLILITVVTLMPDGIYTSVKKLITRRKPGQDLQNRHGKLAVKKQQTRG
ncbi:branched-chain amino acid ABC transporter permease [Metallumcola ferriviriculae]|uniref:Branched-chain amino acid ABC transporter permease n=1 Tax=Metallumcola ferriviriculae TaxID=3039180 RepID=A0AAU0URG8_9FIRM|nr:branched-chain amino acid ABC transporter permease [Desulfitibacteraceae bacterium MK1]